MVQLRPSPRRRGFTLVELLVVIGIIALLIAILLPALQRAQEAAKIIKCLNNCRTMAQAAMVHANDHRGYMPAAGLHWNLNGGVCNPKGMDDEGRRKYTYYRDGSTERPAPMSVAMALSMGMKVPTDDRTFLENFMKTPGFRQYFMCPSQDDVPLGRTQQGSDGWNSVPLEALSYLFNEEFLGRREADKGPTPRGNVAKVKKSSSVFLFGDGLPRADGSNWMTVPATGLNLRTSTMLDYYNRNQASYKNFDMTRHRGKMNVVFVDGHATTIVLPGGLKDVGLCRGMYD